MDFESLITFSDITISIITSRNPSFLRSKKEKKKVKATSIKTARRSKFSSSLESNYVLTSRGLKVKVIYARVVSDEWESEKMKSKVKDGDEKE